MDPTTQQYKTGRKVKTLHEIIRFSSDEYIEWLMSSGTQNDKGEKTPDL